MGKFSPGGIPDIVTFEATGNLAKDAELRGNDNNVCAITIAYNTKAKQGDEWGTEVNYLDCVLFGNLGKSMVAQGRLQKGQPVSVKGVLRQNVYEGKNGTEYKHELILDRDTPIKCHQRAVNGNGSSPAPKAEETTTVEEGEKTPF